ncbi:hypothetical protein B0H11DRAFT_2250074 [Mycena galericulata]|nr:hypothetical protein B0H11DRAFT_2250074 [Mycena galericulata]
MASSSAPRRSSRHTPANAPARATPASLLPAGPSRRPSKKQKAPQVPSDILNPRSLVKKLNENVWSEYWPDFLAKLQLALRPSSPGALECLAQHYRAARQDEHTSLSKWREDDFDHSRSLRRWVESDVSHGRQFSLAVMTTPPPYMMKRETRGETRDEWKECNPAASKLCPILNMHSHPASLVHPFVPPIPASDGHHFFFVPPPLKVLVLVLEVEVLYEFNNNFSVKEREVEPNRPAVQE